MPKRSPSATRPRALRRNANATNDDAFFVPPRTLPNLFARDGSPTIPSALRRLGWNHRILTYDDFLSAVAEEGVELVVRPFSPLGETQCLKGDRKRIILDDGMHRNLRLVVAFHEYAHALLHIHRAKDFDLEQCETEADLVGVCALIPQWLVTTYSAAQLAERLPYSRRLCEFRIQIYQHYDLETKKGKKSWKMILSGSLSAFLLP